MNSIARIVACTLACGACVSSALAQEVAERPDLHVGDTWVFHVTGVDDGKPVDSAWRRRINEILPDGKIRVSPRYETDTFDTSWNPIYSDHPEFPTPDFQFPLRVGAAWSFASPGGGLTRDGTHYDLHGRRKVVAYESITVPAGTFKCFRIEGGSEWVQTHRHGNSDYKTVENWQITNWYCPEIRYIGKSHTETYFGGSSRKGTYRTLDHELVGLTRTASSASVTGVSDPPQPSRFDGSWQGEQGIWRIKGRVAGETIEGTIRCRANDRWSARSPMFSGTVAKDGSVAAITTEDIQGWAPRQISGKLPNLRVVGYGPLNCPNGEVVIKKIE